MTPSSRPSLATASGVPPARAIASAMALISRTASAGMVATAPRDPAGRGHAACRAQIVRGSASTAPLRIEEPPVSTPLMRVCAVNGMKSRLQLRQVARRGCRISPWPAPRSSGLPASRRRARPAAPRPPVPARDTPRTGLNAVAWRLPSVMVPVLSSSRVSTSPAASTARPDIASTLKRTSRSMPAMPIADSSAPIVVGIRVTNSATSTTTEIWPPA